MGKITLLEKNRIYGPTKENPDIALTYPRLIELMHNGSLNGTLLSTGESLDIGGFRIHESKDGGKTWEHISSVFETIDPELIANWQPHLFELPCKVGSMKEGTIILSGCAHDKKVQTTTKMCLWRSFDAGKTFEEFAVVAEGGGLSKGLYEPFCITSDDGRLFCFYSDETEWEKHSQMLVCKYSYDGINWSDRIIVVACDDPKLRPGMITISRMKNNEYALCYEMVAELGHPTYIKTSKKLDDWGLVSETGYKVISEDGEAPSSTPYLTYLEAGGECGTMFVSGWHLVSLEKGKGSNIYYSNDYGKSWKTLENPLKYSWPEKHRFSYSPCLTKGAREDILYYVNDVNCENAEFSEKADFIFCKLLVE